MKSLSCNISTFILLLFARMIIFNFVLNKEHFEQIVEFLSFLFRLMFSGVYRF